MADTTHAAIVNECEQIYRNLLQMRRTARVLGLTHVELAFLDEIIRACADVHNGLADGDQWRDRVRGAATKFGNVERVEEIFAKNDAVLAGN